MTERDPSSTPRQSDSQNAADQTAAGAVAAGDLPLKQSTKKTPQEEHEAKIRSLGVAATGVVGLFSVFVLGDLLARSQLDWAKNIAPYIFWFGIVFLVFYLIAYISHSRFTRLIGGEVPSQAAFAVFAWFMYAQSSLQASVLINAIYGTDSSSFANTSQVMTFVEMFKLSRPLIYVVVAWSLVSFLHYAFSKKRETRMSAYRSMVMLSGAVFGILSLVFIEQRFTDDLLLKKTYLIAKELDFNMRVHCNMQRIDGTGIFLGPGRERVLLDPVPSSQPWTTSIYATAEELRDVQIPAHFRFIDCRQHAQ